MPTEIGNTRDKNWKFAPLVDFLLIGSFLAVVGFRYFAEDVRYIISDLNQSETAISGMEGFRFSPELSSRFLAPRQGGSTGFSVSFPGYADYLEGAGRSIPGIGRLKAEKWIFNPEHQLIGQPFNLEVEHLIPQEEVNLSWKIIQKQLIDQVALDKGMSIPQKRNITIDTDQDPPFQRVDFDIDLPDDEIRVDLNTGLTVSILKGTGANDFWIATAVWESARFGNKPLMDQVLGSMEITDPPISRSVSLKCF